jgi:MFS transporter, NNP family, nitrate/nitrite transporter
MGDEERKRQIAMEPGAIVAFNSAIAAFGAFFIPKAYGTSIAMTVSAVGALWGFLIFYVICVVITWVVSHLRHLSA